MRRYGAGWKTGEGGLVEGRGVVETGGGSRKSGEGRATGGGSIVPRSRAEQ
jgi:hypothetical protein